MMDFLRQLRLKNIFDPMLQQNQSPTFPQQPPVMPGGMMPNQPIQPQENNPGLYDVAARMKELYTPDMTAENRFEHMANNFPTQPESSKKRKIGAIALASLSDITGNNKGQGIFDEITGKNKFKEDVSNWKTQITPIQQAADNERATNSNSRTMAHQQIADELRQQAQEATNRKNDLDAKIKQQRADAYEFKARNPNMKIIATKGGNIQAIDPRTGQAHDTGIPTGSLTDADRIALEQTNALARIDAQGQNAQDLEGTRQTNRETNIGLQGDQNRQTKGTPGAPSASANKPETEASIRTGRINKAQQIINSRPDLAKWITVNGTDIRIKPPSTGGMFSSGPTKEQFDEINNAIYGAKPAATTPTGNGRGGGPAPNATNNQDQKPLTKQMRNRITGEVATVISTDGGKTWHRQQQ